LPGFLGLFLRGWIKEERKIRKVGVAIDNCGDVPPEILAHFPDLDRFSTMSLRLEGDDEGSFRSILMVMKEGLGLYTEEHARLLEIVKEPFTIAMGNARVYIDLLRLKNQLADENKEMQTELFEMVPERVVGSEFGLKQVMGMVKTVAPTASPVLLLGETGTGKEVIARSVHDLSPRRDKPFIRVQCGAMPDTLLDSELFGHEKGAFTGAVGTKRGRFERADGGTIFLDEIGELSAEAQVKLLRVLQEKEFERVGGTTTHKVDVRVVAATHRDLKTMVESGKFREDLWFRLNVFPVILPPLRDRKQDIPALVQYFADKKVRELNLPAFTSMDKESMDRLLDYDWPGNVRELQNVIERALIINNGGVLKIPVIGTQAGQPVFASPEDSGIFLSLDEVISRHIQNALDISRGRIEGDGGAADLLGLNPSTLRGKLRKLKIPFGKKG
jgi:transcriptional regulator with GAF, ATPase, and Fis domain